MAFNLNSGFGQQMAMQAAAICPTFGKIFIVSKIGDLNKQNLQDMYNYDDDGELRFFATIEGAYAAAESNRNDVILLDAQSSHVLSEGLEITKNRVHFYGMDGGDRLVQQGAKVTGTDGAASAFLIKDTGNRNSFTNIKFIQNDTDAAALTVAQFGGEGTLSKNCSYTFGVSDNLSDTDAHEVVCGTDSATFIDNQFGQDTLLTSAARAVFYIDQVTTSQEFKSNRFRGNTYLISSSEATAYLLELAANTDVLFSNLFENENFVASLDSAGGAALTNAITSAASLVKGTLNFASPNVFGCTNFSANDSTQVQVTGTPTATTNAFEAVTPA